VKKYLNSFVDFNKKCNKYTENTYMPDFIKIFEYAHAIGKYKF
jgi:hypothetical protein